MATHILHTGKYFTLDLVMHLFCTPSFRLSFALAVVCLIQFSISSERCVDHTGYIQYVQHVEYHYYCKTLGDLLKWFHCTSSAGNEIYLLLRHWPLPVLLFAEVLQMLHIAVKSQPASSCRQYTTLAGIFGCKCEQISHFVARNT